MELFIMNRYIGDEEEKTPSVNAKELRNQLLQKIDMRKRQNQMLNNNLNEGEGSLEKKKCHKISMREKGSLSLDSNGSIKKKKKKKLKNSMELLQNGLENGSPDEKNEIKPVNYIEESENEYGENVDLENNEVDEQKTEGKEENQIPFTILKDPQLHNKKKVKRKLPEWLANPSVVSVDLKNLQITVDSIPELDKIFVDELKKNGITHFFPVQQQVIPCLLEGADTPKMFWPRDICVSAPTGSGKTLAFVLPILQILHKRIVPKIRALVVLPVQDLANQVFQVFKAYSKPTNLKVILLTKMRTFEEEQELIRKEDAPGDFVTLVDIVITTPGRLVEHLVKTKGLNLENLRFLVLDEADRVMESMQNDWLYHLNKHIYGESYGAYQIPVITYNNLVNLKRPPHKLLFSATLSQDPEKLHQMGLFHPRLYTSVVKASEKAVEDETKFIGKYTTPAELKEYYCLSSKANKPLILHHLITAESWRNVLCFVNSAEATKKLAFLLKNLSDNKMKIKQLSAHLTLKERNSVIKKFSQGQLDVLISSDALARGIDIPNVKYVVSYDCPKFVKTYVHRIGRTGRAGKEGTSLTLLVSKEVNSFNKMILSAGKSSVSELKFDEEKLEEYDSVYEKALSSLAEHLEKIKVQSMAEIKNRKKIQSLAEKGKFLSKKRLRLKKNMILKRRKPKEI